MQKETRVSPVLNRSESDLAGQLEGGRTLLTRKVWSRRSGWRMAVKRTIDIIGSVGLIALFSPLMLVVAVLIKCTDGGPVLFWQDRVGKWGRVFRFPKFRSMVVGAEAMRDKLEELNEHGKGSVTFKIKNDPRVTWIGRIIRRASIDELPQIWNVLIGEMSLVGPRPPLPKEVEKYTLDDRRRLDVKPGLTCLWQVQGRAEIPFKQQVELDVEYIQNQSVASDVKLLAKTLPAVIKGKGAS